MNHEMCFSNVRLIMSHDCSGGGVKGNVALVTTHTDTGWFLQTGVLYAVKTITSKHKTKYDISK